MTNTPQSSRLAGSYNRSLFTNLGDKQMKKPSYFAEKTFTQSGDSNPQIKEKTPANIGHIIVGAAIIVAVVFALHKGFQKYGM